MPLQVGRGIREDLQARLPWYVSDWKEGFQSGYRIFAPSVYIFFASVIPALAFGEQIEHHTHGKFNGVHVLLSAAIAGVVQSFIGGQPLLIMGVAEPIALMYGFMYEFADGQDFTDVFVPWCTWVTIWTSIFLFIFSITGLSKYINKFTRFSGELFGLLIAVLFMQQAIKGVVLEFQVSRCGDVEDLEGAAAAAACVAAGEYTGQERLVNGLWATLLALGTLLTSMLVQTARTWPFFSGGVRSFLADYGVPLMVIVWTAVSYALQSATPGGIPRRLALPNTWDAAAKRNYGVLLDLGECSGAQIAYAVIPAAIIALLFYFDHNVSAQLAQQKDFQLVRPPAYHWDMSVVALLMALAGFIGVPPANCVIPQAPMHTKSLVTLKKMLVQRDERKKSRLNLPELASDTDKGSPEAEAAAEGASGGGGELEAALQKHGLEREYIRLKGGVVPLNVKEQRLSNLLQSLLILACVCATPVVRRIPKSVLWGYFAYMSLESLPGSELWSRILLLFTDRRKRVEMLQRDHPVYLETVTYANVVKFTLLQLVLLAAVWGITWAGAIGIGFPFLIILFIPGRQYVMPRLFDAWTLSQLDAADYEEAPPAPEWVVREAAKREGGVSGFDAECAEREALEHEMVGARAVAIRHHVSADEVRQRRESLQRESSRGGAGAEPRTDVRNRLFQSGSAASSSGDGLPVVVAGGARRPSGAEAAPAPAGGGRGVVAAAAHNSGEFADADSADIFATATSEGGSAAGTPRARLAG